jgi:hypothetical protein
MREISTLDELVVIRSPTNGGFDASLCTTTSVSLSAVLQPFTTFAVVTVILIAGMRWSWIVLGFFLLYILAITEEVLRAHLASRRSCCFRTREKQKHVNIPS